MARTESALQPLGPASLARVAAIYGMFIIPSKADCGLMIFDFKTVTCRGRVPDSDLVNAADDTARWDIVVNRLKELSGEMGSLYALRAEAAFASPAERD